MGHEYGTPFIKIQLEGGPDLGKYHIREFQWSSFTNGGYIIRASFDDPYINNLRRLFVTPEFLKNMRKKPTEVIFQIGWLEPNRKSVKQIAYLIDIKVHEGEQNLASIEFVAIDPPSWWLNAGKGDGKVYKGNVSSTIQQVIADYAPNIDYEVSETTDNKQNRWAMMRQDPRSFISSLLDWSSSVTNNKTNWIVASDGDVELTKPKIIIKEQAELVSNDLGLFNCHSTNTGATDMHSFEFVADALLTNFQSKLNTQGISGVSGQFLDKINDKLETVVDDSNTSNKVNTVIKEDAGFAKTTQEYSTSIKAIPELNGREMGKKYGEYIDGRARSKFLTMLPRVMRLNTTMRGIPEISKSTDLGVSKVTLRWNEMADGNNGESPPYFLSGNWLVYGFNHKIMTHPENIFCTDLYLYRIDYDAEAKKV